MADKHLCRSVVVDIPKNSVLNVKIVIYFNASKQFIFYYFMFLYYNFLTFRKKSIIVSGKEIYLNNFKIILCISFSSI